MIKENKRILMITSLIILLPVLVGLLLWHQLPEQIPVHFNSEGVADSYQSKLWGVTFIYLVIFACHWFAAIITSVDPRRRNISSKIYRLVLWICPVISVFVGGYDLWYGSELAMGEYQFYGQSAARCDIHCHRQLSAEMSPELYNWYQAAMDTE